MIKQFNAFILFTFILFSSHIFATTSFAEVSQAPDIDLPGLNANVQLKNYKGKVVYLDFWASWCLPCQKSFPWMHDIKQKYASRGFEIVAINLDKDKKLADEFLKGMDVNFVVAFDDSGKSASAYKLRGMPSSYLIGRDGKIHASHIGFRDQDKAQLEQVITDLLVK
ncbi:MAG: TlpA disulfide reductase family protein [Gammaproteobacteria bacterium]|nr:TlpA disulfide reductase family protein [Gammaproteobacteria bacterium]